MKTFDLKSLLLGVSLTLLVAVVMLLATQQPPPVVWEYKTLHFHPFTSLQELNNGAAKEGWEAVSVGSRDSGGRTENFVLVRKPKATTSRAAWWKFWK